MLKLSVFFVILSVVNTLEIVCEEVVNNEVTILLKWSEFTKPFHNLVFQLWRNGSLEKVVDIKSGSRLKVDGIHPDVNYTAIVYSVSDARVMETQSLNFHTLTTNPSPGTNFVTVNKFIPDSRGGSMSVEVSVHQTDPKLPPICSYTTKLLSMDGDGYQQFQEQQPRFLLTHLDCNSTFTLQVWFSKNQYHNVQFTTPACNMSLFTTPSTHSTVMTSLSKRSSSKILLSVSVCGAVLVLLLAVYCTVRRCCRSKTKDLSSLMNMDMKNNVVYDLSVSTSLDQSPESSDCVDHLEIAPENLCLQDKVGFGFSGQVFRGVLRCGMFADSYRQVAVKCLQYGASEEQERRFQEEIELMTQLGNHPNVVSLVGYITAPGQPLCLLTELCDGDLLKRLWSPPRLVESGLVSAARQVASGMQHIAGLGLVHRDLAARNVLIGKDGLLKVADFGLCRATPCDAIYQQTSDVRVPFRWLAPECLEHQRYSTASDVWSFGVLLWELFTLGAAPWSDLTPGHLLRRLKAGDRLLMPRECPQSIWKLAQDCWNWEASLRPDFTKIRQDLEFFLTVSGEYLNLAV